MQHTTAKVETEWYLELTKNATFWLVHFILNIHHRHPIAHPDGRAMGVYSEYFNENTHFDYEIILYIVLVLQYGKCHKAGKLAICQSLSHYG